MWCIYKHENKRNGKVYIGQTIHQNNPQLRWDYGSGYKSEQNKFYNAITKYGWNGFTHEIIERDILTQEEANLREIYWISHYDSFRFGYNSTPGGNCRPSNLKSASNHKKPVCCYETKETFSCATTASEEKDINASAIKSCCKGRAITAGGYHWCYCEDIDTFVPKEPKEPKIKTFKVINEQTKEIFESVTEASKKTGLNEEYIRNRCNGNIVSNTTWFYYDEEIRKQHPQKKPSVNYFSKETKKVVCLEDKRIFNNVYFASKEYKTTYRCINQCCLKYKGTKINKELKHFMFLDDFKKLYEDIIKEDN